MYPYFISDTKQIIDGLRFMRKGKTFLKEKILDNSVPIMCRVEELLLSKYLNQKPNRFYKVQTAAFSYGKRH